MLKRKCRVCGDVFQVPPKQATRAYCDRPECQLARRQKNLDRDKQHYRLVQKGVKTVKAKSKPDIGRRCRRCGKNCYPNFFFCSECHHYVSVNEWRCPEDDECTL